MFKLILAVNFLFGNMILRSKYNHLCFWRIKLQAVLLQLSKYRCHYPTFGLIYLYTTEAIIYLITIYIVSSDTNFLTSLVTRHLHNMYKCRCFDLTIISFYYNAIIDFEQRIIYTAFRMYFIIKRTLVP